MVTTGPVPAESGSVKTSSIIIPIHYWSVSLTMSGCWQLCSPDALRAPDNSVVCHDFASRCRPRLSVAQDVVSPAGGACKSRGSLTRSSFLSRRQHEDPGGPRRFATAAPWGTDAAHHLGWPIEVHRHTGREVVGIVLRCGPRRLAGDNGSFSVAHRGPRTSSVQKIPGLTATLQSNGEMPGRDTSSLSTAPGHSHRQGIVRLIGAGTGAHSRSPGHQYERLGALSSSFAFGGHRRQFAQTK
jgi:hypothetical protein